MKLGRREFLGRSGACLLGAAAGLASFPSSVRGGLSNALPSRQAGATGGPGFGLLRRDPENILDLPKGFSYRIISKAGQRMKDGFVVPSLPDGMAAFPGPDGSTLILRNHEFRFGHPATLGPFGGKKNLWKKLDKSLIYDWTPDGTPCLGSVTTIVYDTKRKKTKSQHLSLAGTVTNCSGGATPWGTWLSSEEVFEGPGNRYAGKHGYTFEVAVSAEPKVTAPLPLKAMGRFVKEGAAVDPRTGIVYQTEDQVDGLFYRFLPAAPGRLAEGGRLQALAVAGLPGLETNNWKVQRIAPGTAFVAVWIDLDNPDPGKDTLRARGREKGAAVFASGEGILFHADEVWFDCTNGGTEAKGHFWRYSPSPDEGTPRESENPGRLELFLEPNDPLVLDHPDQLAAAPWGDILVCEDGDGDQYLLGITKRGDVYKFARNALDPSELSGCCFSPDGTTMFVNNMDSGLTFAVTGPWKK
jgi:secreted PhoX family phosphatase